VITPDLIHIKVGLGNLSHVVISGMSAVLWKDKTSYWALHVMEVIVLCLYMDYIISIRLSCQGKDNRESLLVLGTTSSSVATAMHILNCLLI